MTKEEWQVSTNIRLMLDFAKLSERKRILFACNCVRHIWHLLNDNRSKKAVEVAELYADNKVTETELIKARQDAFDAAVSASYSTSSYSAAAAAATAATAATAAPVFAAVTAYNAAIAVSASYNNELEWQANLLRHMVKIYDKI